jgi:PleD family two-component response regulator
MPPSAPPRTARRPRLADAFIEARCGKRSPFSAAFIRIDRIKELNRLLGAQAVGLLIKDLAALVKKREPEAFLFRWTGPVLLLEEGGEGIFGRLDGLRQAIASDKRFMEPISASIALVRSGELGGGGLPSLIALGRDRLKLLDRRGGDDILDPNPIFLDFLVESLERESFRTQGAARGGKALELMDGTRPELVIADAALPQFDAFQIRMRMRASADLHDIPFILIADRKADELVARAHSLGLYHVFEKPVSMVELVGVARSLVARSEDEA